MREKAYENKIKDYLHSLGIYQAGTPKQDKETEQIGWFIKFWGGGMSQVGIPDILGLVNGKFFAIEVKGEGGRPSTLQLINLEEIEKSGGLARLSYPEDFEKLKEEIKCLI